MPTPGHESAAPVRVSTAAPQSTLCELGDGIAEAGRLLRAGRKGRL
jgi:hypothetical protein